MLPLKLVHSLVSGESIHNPFHKNQNPDHQASNSPKKHIKKHPFLIFIPTNQLIQDTYTLATFSRNIGLNLYPNPSLSHIIFSWPLHSSHSSHSSCSSNPSSSATSSSSSLSWSLPENAVPLPFPSLANASLSNLRFFASFSRGYFKLVFLKSGFGPVGRMCDRVSNWDCCSGFLRSRRDGSRVDSMDGFCKVLAGAGWSFFKSCNKVDLNSVYLFRKMDLNRVRTERECRVRELRLPELDFGNAPLRILQYILLMTDDVFYLV